MDTAVMDAPEHDVAYKTDISIDGERFLINGRSTYAGRMWQGKRIEGLLFNSRMIQGIFDDENPETCSNWNYPDTGTWDPERNTDELCAMLPEYRRHGVLGITVGLQGGGSMYAPHVYDTYKMTAFTGNGDLKPAYFERLHRILGAADIAGMVVIVNYFYWRQIRFLQDDAAIDAAARNATRWLLGTGYRNILVDAVNESNEGLWKECPYLQPASVHNVINVIKGEILNGRRLLVGASTGGGLQMPQPAWLEAEDFTLPHGNGCSAAQVGVKIRTIKDMDAYKRRPRPVMINEDSSQIANLDASVDNYASWGLYLQGAGSGGRQPYDAEYGSVREKDTGALSGYQTLPVNWGINTDKKRAFFGRVAEITGS